MENYQTSNQIDEYEFQYLTNKYYFNKIIINLQQLKLELDNYDKLLFTYNNNIDDNIKLSLYQNYLDIITKYNKIKVLYEKYKILNK